MVAIYIGKVIEIHLCMCFGLACHNLIVHCVLDANFQEAIQASFDQTTDRSHVSSQTKYVILDSKHILFLPLQRFWIITLRNILTCPCAKHN